LREPCAGTRAGNTQVSFQVLQGMSTSVTSASPPRAIILRRRKNVKLIFSGVSLSWLLASVFVHVLPHAASDRATAPLLLGADISSSVVAVFAHACVNRHSEKTQWPWYSHVAPVSWLVENDVNHAREHLNLSRSDGLQKADQRMPLTEIATVIENREMPPHKYVVFHPEAKLSPDEFVRVIEWAHAERRRLRASAASLAAKQPGIF
jgi:Haem-binding domain